MPPTDHLTPTKWTDDELTAAVKAYVGMLRDQVAGKPFNKKAINRTLREGPLSARTSSSVELRMQNISAVMAELGRPRVVGYLPATGVGSNVRERIIAILKKTEISFFDSFVATADTELLERRVEKLRKLGAMGVPAGSKAPATVSVTSTTYERDPHVRAWVLENAKGVCEGCLQPAPFADAKGHPFLEVHHVRHLARRGSDCISNAVALCPNCHRRCHISDDKDGFTASFYERIERLVVEADDGGDEPFVELIDVPEQ